VVVVLGESDGVLFVFYRHGNVLLGDYFLHGQEFIAQDGRPFKVHRRGSLFHPCLQIGGDLLLFPLEKMHHLVYDFGVLFFSYGPDAGPRAVVDVVVEAGATVGAGNGLIAGAQGKDTL